MDSKPEDTSWMSRCFVIMDNMIHNERAKSSEIPLFFYPNNTELESQIHTFSVFLAVTSVADHCTDAPVAIVGLKRVKMAYKRDGEYLLVLTGDIRDSNKALLHHVDLLYDCFLFNTGGFSLLEAKANKSRTALQKYIGEAGSLLVPLIENFHQSSMKFSPMPYIKMRSMYKATSAYFVQAWQLTNILENSTLFDKLYGTALMFHDRVVCTHVDVTATRWIVNYIEYLNSNKTPPESEGHAFRSTSEAMSFVSRIFFCTVYLNKQTTERKAEVWKSMGKDINPEKVGEYTKAGLSIITLYGGISIVSLCHWDAYQTSNEILDTTLGLILTQKSLIDHLTNTLHHASYFPPIRSESGGRRLDDGDDEVRMHSRGWDDDVDHEPRPEEGGPERPYNFFAFDAMTERQTEHRGNLKADAEANFNASINWARDLFSERPQVAKLVLRNHSGTILCKKNFGKESFFQSATCKLEDIELIARDYLSADYNTTFM